MGYTIITINIYDYLLGGIIMIYGYARVSSKDQNEHRQLISFSKFNIPDKNIYIDKQSGKNFNRKNYQILIRKIKKGDLVYIKSIDRLGRNYEEIIEQWSYITKKKQADIFVIDMPLLDTRKGRDLMGTFLSDIVLQVLSFVAENERVNIKQRQAEGIAAAKARGIKFGRPIIPIPENFEYVYNEWINKKITLDNAAEKCNMKRSTFYSKAIRLKNSI